MTQPHPPTLGRAAHVAVCALLALALAAVAWAVATAGAGAQGAERIHRYAVTIVIMDAGDLDITEVIEYDFGTQQRHGIYRTIPYRYYYDDRYDRVMPVEVLEVVGSRGTPDQWVREDSGSSVSIRIGDPDRTITGAHTYTIRYRVQGALNGFAEHDELYWNAIGAEWGVPIGGASVRVVAPTAVTAVTCFAGPSGSVLPCDRAWPAADHASFEQDGLSSYEGLTVVVAFPPGAVPMPGPMLVERWSFERAFSVTPYTAGAMAAVAALVAGLLGRVLWLAGRDRRWAGSPVDAVFGSPTGDEGRVPLFQGGPYPVEYSPPESVRPGELGTLRDERANPLDISATIVDLAVRGYLRIEEVPGTGFLSRRPDWKLTRLLPSVGMLRYEQILLDGLFQSGDEVLLSELKQQFASRLQSVQEALYEAMVEHGWYRRRPDRTRQFWLMGGIVALAASVGLVVLVAATTHWGIVPLPLAAGAIAMIGMHHLTPSRTAHGTAMLRRVRGFQRFIASAEVHRARFAEEAQLLYAYLPYAIVFGLTDRWARAFEGIDAVTPPAWYVGPRAFQIAAFTESMQAFTVSSSGTIAATAASSGSSGFGGGGSSGGGGGGGGGGSW